MLGRFEPFIVQVGEVQVKPQKSVRYLGVILDEKLNFKDHLQQAAKKTDKICNDLATIMPNIKGPQESKRRLLPTVIESTVLYGVTIWEKIFTVQKSKNILDKIQRKVALRVSMAYRTVGIQSARVLARPIPYEILAKERKTTINKTITKKEARRNSLLSWQKMWSEYDGSIWTHKLIPDVVKWYERKHGQLNYHLTQFLTGHGCFRQFLCSIKKAEDPFCDYCQEEDKAEHTIFRCPNWNQIRERMTNFHLFTPETIVERMLDSQENWKNRQDIIVSIIKCKISDERMKQDR